MEKVLVLFLVFHMVFTLDCPGRITGIPCPSPKDLIREFQPSINNIKAKIATVYKTTGDSTISTRSLIQNNIADAKNLTNQSFLKIRNLLNAAKLEAVGAPPRVRACIIDQTIELGKIRPGIYLGCSGNFTKLQEVRRQILLLEELAIELFPFCSRLNPINNELVNLRMCLDRKTKDLQVQLLILEQKFAHGVKEVVNFSTKCVMRESARVHARIGAIEGAVKNCKNVGFV